jgi:hypothetical protein
MGMMDSFIPPVLIELQVIGEKALAQLQGINAELATMEGQATKAGTSLSTLDKSVKMATTALLAAGVAAVALGALSVKAAMDAQVSWDRLDVALKNTQNHSVANIKTMHDLANAGIQLGFTAGNTAEAMGSLITATGSVDESTKLLTSTMDLARYKGIDLATAATIMARGTQGSAKAFKELGITLDTSLPKQQAINKAFDELQTKIGGQAHEYMETFRGKLAVVSAEFKHMEGVIGGYLIPVLQTLMNFTIKYGGILVQLAASIGVAAFALKGYEAATTAYLAVNAYMATALVAEDTAIAAIRASALGSADAVGALTLADTALADAAAAGVGPMTALSAAMDANPIGVMVIAVLALGAALLGVWKLFQWFATSTPPAVGDSSNIHQASVDGVHGYYTSVAGGGGKGGAGAQRRFIPYAAMGGQDENNPEQQYQAAIPKGGLTSESDASLFHLDSYTGRTPAIKLTQAQKDAAAALKKKERDAAALKKHNDSVLASSEKSVHSIYGQEQSVIDAQHKDQNDAYQKMLYKDGEALKKYNNDTAKLRTDEAAKEAQIVKDGADKIATIKSDSSQRIIDMQIAENDTVEKLRQKAEDQHKSIIAQSIALFTDAFKSATKIDLAQMFVDGGSNVDKLLVNMKKSLKDAQDFAKNEAKLASQGYSQEFLTQLASQGSVTGNKLAEQLLKGGDTSDQIKEVFKKLQDVSNHGADSTGKQLYDTQGFANDSLKQQYAQVTADLESAIADAQKQLDLSILAEQKSASKAIDDVNKATAKSILTEQTNLDKALQSAADALGQTLTDAFTAYDSAVQIIADKTTAKIDALQAKLTLLATTIAAIAGKSAGVQVGANSPAAGFNPNLAPVFTGGTINANQTGATPAGTGTTINLGGVKISGNMTAAELTQAIVDALTLGVPSTVTP